MTDELERLRTALRAGARPAHPAARAQDIAAAMAAYDEEFSGAAQEPGAAARPTPEASPFRRRLIGRLKMHSGFPKPSLRPLLMGGAAMATVLIAVAFVQEAYQYRPSALEPPSSVANAPSEAFRDGDEALEARRDTATPEGARGSVLADRLEKKETEEIVAGDTIATLDGEEPKDLSVKDLLGIEEVFEEVDTSTVVVSRGGFVEERIEVDATPEAASRAGASAPTVAASEAPAILPDHRRPVAESDTERYPDFAENAIKSTGTDPVSTFSIDVDTAAYGVVRSSLMAGRTPPAEAVRIEEMINYFPYDYPGPESAETPFRANVEVFPSPWKPTNRLVRIGIKGYELAPEDRPRANLVFLIDTSGSMAAQNKLPLLLQSFRLMLPTLDPEDTVAIVAYAGSAGVVLEPTPAGESRKILAALGRLRSGGSTAGGAGLELAYALAEEAYDDEGVNRVILATDGDFNVGISDPERLKTFVEEKRETGIGLSVLGFGRGNYNDALMQTLAQNGDGNAAYIDSLAEAQKVLVEETASTLFTIARDVKIQVEFNPATVSEYRLIGYETRALKREDFNNDKVDAGEIGAGHTVTALYEITPVGAPGSVDPLRYGAAGEAAAPEPAAAGPAEEYGFLKMRYKLPGEATSRLITRPIAVAEARGSIEAASVDARFAAAVAGFGQILRGGAQTGAFDYDDVIALSLAGRGPDPYGYRAEFTRLVRLAQSIDARRPAAAATRE